MTNEELDQHLGYLRPRLHRYCARMTGSVIDGEDVLQDALVKAAIALSRSGKVENLEGWLFRIAHNAAIDFLRKRAKAQAALSDEDPEMLSDVEHPTQDRDIVAASLTTFMRLPVVQRSAVILMDVLGYRLQEICEIMEAKLPAVKSALHRGRLRLKHFAREKQEQPAPVWSSQERALLQKYIDRFNARDFEAVRDMLAEEVRLDLVSRAQREGRKDVSTYFENYTLKNDWVLSPGFVDGQAAIVVYDARNPAAGPVYFVILKFIGDHVSSIRDFRYARYAIDGAEVILSSI